MNYELTVGDLTGKTPEEMEEIIRRVHERIKMRERIMEKAEEIACELERNKQLEDETETQS